VRASASTAALVVDWATLAALGAATLALMVATWRPRGLRSRQRHHPASPLRGAGDKLRRS